MEHKSGKLNCICTPRSQPSDSVPRTMTSADDIVLAHVKELIKAFDISTEEYENFCQIMVNTMARGLKRETHAESSIKMYPTYVSNIPNGTETGCFLALDLGGTNYRVLLVHLQGAGKAPVIEERTYAIPRSKMSGTGQELFQYIADTLADFVRGHDLGAEASNLGFTFSFPCMQKGLTNATLVRWTKGFKATDVEGANVAQLLQNAIDKTGINVKCVAVVNDTVGTLASCALEDPKCAIGLIVGTGTNAAYIEKRENVELIDGECPPYVVINTEWGAFGENGEFDYLLTPWDKAVDAESLYPGKQIFEKMVSGMYLGEIVRHVLIYLVQEGILFRGEMPEKLLQKDSVHTKYLTETERDPNHLFYSTHYMLTEDLNVPVVEPVDAKIVRHVCEVVCKRAAFLVGAGIAALLRRMKRPEVTIGIDGSLYKFHPKFRERMTDMIDRLRPKNLSTTKNPFRLRLSEDGSGKGAAAIAAAACR